MTCDFCQVQQAMRQIMALIDDLPEINEPLYDDAVTDVYNAADNALGRFEHYPHDEEVTE